MKEHQILATLMTPSGYGAADARWDTARNVAFYGITYWYTFQASATTAPISIPRGCC